MEHGMSRRHNPNRTLGALREPIERLAQANIAMVLVQAVIIRLSLEMSNGVAGEPDPLVLLAFLATSVLAGALVFALGRVIRRFPHRWLRVSLAVGSLLLQAAAFQALYAWAA
jgi:hypothetical protein